MIRSKSRKGWIGASDTAMVMGNWNTDTFRKWWLVKLGLATNEFKSRQMAAGTAYEHKILHAVGITKTDRQIRCRRLRLRVNLDGETREEISEVKTHGKPVFKISKAYWQQSQVEMFAARKKLRIVAYRMTEAEYANFFLPIDLDRVTLHTIEFDVAWIEDAYLPRLIYLAYCFRKGKMPDACEIEGYVNRVGKPKADRFFRDRWRLFRRV